MRIGVASILFIQMMDTQAVPQSIAIAGFTRDRRES